MMADLKIRFGMSESLIGQTTIVLKFNIPLHVDIFLYLFWFNNFLQEVGTK